MRLSEIRQCSHRVNWFIDDGVVGVGDLSVNDTYQQICDLLDKTPKISAVAQRNTGIWRQ